MLTFKGLLLSEAAVLIMEDSNWDKTWATHKEAIIDKASNDQDLWSKQIPAGRPEPGVLNDAKNVARGYKEHAKWIQEYTANPGKGHFYHSVSMLPAADRPAALDRQKQSRQETMQRQDDSMKNFFGEQFAAAAPHPKYVPFIAKMYAKSNSFPGGGIHRFEDVHSSVKNELEKYHQLATSRKLDPNEKVHDVIEDPRGGGYGDTEIKPTNISHTAFNQFQNMDHLRQVTQHDKYADFFRRKESPEDKDYTHVHEDANWNIYVPHTWQAASSLAYDSHHKGSKAHWCTAIDNEKDTAFHHYNGEGSLFIMHRKADKGRENNVYQMHLMSDQLMDHHDEPLQQEVTDHGGEIIRQSTETAFHHLINGANLSSTQKQVRNTKALWNKLEDHSVNHTAAKMKDNYYVDDGLAYGDLGMFDHLGSHQVKVMHKMQDDQEKGQEYNENLLKRVIYDGDATHFKKMLQHHTTEQLDYYPNNSMIEKQLSDEHDNYGTMHLARQNTDKPQEAHEQIKAKLAALKEHHPTMHAELASKLGSI